MKRGYLLTVLLIATTMAAAACGGGSGSTTTGDAAVSSLSSLPSVDLSTYDKSVDASASTSLVSSVSNTIASKGWAEDMREVGKMSRAGCEANMHKKEMIRMSQTVQLSRCYPEAMEKVGLITIPEDSLKYYELTPPEMEEENRGNLCEGIPPEDVQRREACEAGEGGDKAGVDMKMRIGIIGGALQVDMCEGGVLVDESTYSASGSVYNVSAVHIGSWGGQTEKSSFSMLVDLGADGSVTDGVVDLGSSGSASATGNMNGGFGSGVMSFEAVGSDNSNKVYGAFAGSFTDPFTNTSSSFTGKVYSHFGGSTATGCAKYSFGGTMPPMRVQDMIPFGISDDELDNFLQAFGNELGIQLNSNNYQDILLCDNPNFDPETPSEVIRPMIAISSGETCQEVTHTGIECFAITNVTRQGDFGSNVSQSFTIIANSSSPYYDEVNAYDVASLAASITEPAFVRNWDCTGSFEALDFASLISSGNAATIETAMQKCRALEEKAFANEGMGGYDCGREEQMNGVNDFAGGGADFGTYGGEYGFAESSGAKVNTCARPGEGAPEGAGRLFVDHIGDSSYCFPDPSIGRCQSFTVNENTDIGTPDDVIAIDSWEIVQLEYDLNSNPQTVKVTYDTGAGNCIQYYFLEQHTFNGPAEFGGEGGSIPAACLNPDGTPVPEQVCHEICSDPSIDCRVEGGSGEFF